MQGVVVAEPAQIRVHAPLGRRRQRREQRVVLSPEGGAVAVAQAVHADAGELVAARRRVALQAHLEDLRCGDAELEAAEVVVEFNERNLVGGEAVAHVVDDRLDPGFALVEPAVIHAGQAPVGVTVYCRAAESGLLLGDEGRRGLRAALQFAGRSLREERVHGHVGLVHVVVVEQCAGALRRRVGLERASVLAQHDSGSHPFHATVENNARVVGVEYEIAA